MQNLLPCGYVIHSTSEFSKPNIQYLNSQKHVSRMWTCQCKKKYNFDVQTAFYTPIVSLSIVL
jgi:hypothetical protein